VRKKKENTVVKTLTRGQKDVYSKGSQRKTRSKGRPNWGVTTTKKSLDVKSKALAKKTQKQPNWYQRLMQRGEKDCTSDPTPFTSKKSGTIKT